MAEDFSYKLLLQLFPRDQRGYETEQDVMQTQLINVFGESCVIKLAYFIAVLQ